MLKKQLFALLLALAVLCTMLPLGAICANATSTETSDAEVDYNALVEDTEDPGEGDDSDIDIPLVPGGSSTPLPTLSFVTLSNRVSTSAEKQVWSQNDLTVTNEKTAESQDVGEYHNPARFGAKTKLTFEYKYMAKLAINCVSSAYAEVLVASIPETEGVTVTQDGAKVIIAFAESQKSFTIESLAEQVRMTGITVTAGETPLEDAVPEGETLRLRGTNVDFASSLTLNFNNYAEDLSQYEDVFVIFEAEGKEPVKVTEYTVSGGRWNFGYEGLTIMDVNLTINATIYGTKDGVLYKDSKVRTYSLLRYALGALGFDSNGNLTKTPTNDAVPCANLLKYAIAAEAYKGKTALADTLTAEQKAQMEAYAYADSQFAASSTNKTTSNAVGTQMKFSGQSVLMDSRITLIYKMAVLDDTLDMSKVTFKISYTDAEGNPQVKNYTIDDAIKTDAGYEMNFAEFHATQLNAQALLTVYIDGVEHCSYGNSVENYCYVTNKNSSGNNSAEMIALAKRILLYGDACAATYGG